MCLLVARYNEHFYVSIEPEMAELLVIVIPLIQAEWEDVAHILRFDIHMVDAFGDKHKNDPSKCCREMLKDWLKSDRGVSPKTWSTLLDVIGELPNLAAAKEKIMEKLAAAKEKIMKKLDNM